MVHMVKKGDFYEIEFNQLEENRLFQLYTLIVHNYIDSAMVNA